MFKRSNRILTAASLGRSHIECLAKSVHHAGPIKDSVKLTML